MRDTGPVSRRGRFAASAGALALVAVLTAGCASVKEEMSTMIPQGPGLVAQLRSPSSAATGSVRIVDYRDGVSVQLSINNLMPGQYRIALHENGNCSSFNLYSAGPPWAPPGSSKPPADLLPGFLANQEGNQNGYVAFISGVHTDGRSPLIGRSVVIHWGNVVGEAFPGQANNRFACGVLQPADQLL
jgi:Cu/Zn superoxide dismutase